MNTQEKEESTPGTRMMHLIWGALWVQQALHVAAKLGIADRLAEGAKTSDELASSTGAAPRPLYRVLRALASVGVFREDEEGRFDLTPLGATLRSDAPASTRAMAMVSGEPWHMKAWSSFFDAVRTGTPAWELAFGKSIFQYFTEDPEKADLFNRAMTGFSAQEAGAVAEAYDFSGAQTIVDVGGGYGFLLASVLEKYPRARGILFDVPSVIGGAKKVLQGSPVEGRLEFLPGNFFRGLPAGGDVYMMKHVLHDWSDEACVRILARCREAMRDGGRVLVIQEVLPTGDAPSFGKLMDLQMLLVGGEERSEAQFRLLFAAAGLKLDQVVPTRCPLSVLEATRA